jgi:hypothetical protein
MNGKNNHLIQTKTVLWQEQISLYSDQAMAWKTAESRLDFWQDQQIFRFSKSSRPFLVFIQPPIEWVQGGFPENKTSDTSPPTRN